MLRDACCSYYFAGLRNVISRVGAAGPVTKEAVKRISAALNAKDESIAHYDLYETTVRKSFILSSDQGASLLAKNLDLLFKVIILSQFFVNPCSACPAPKLQLQARKEPSAANECRNGDQKKRQSTICNKWSHRGSYSRSRSTCVTTSSPRVHCSTGLWLR